MKKIFWIFLLLFLITGGKVMAEVIGKYTVNEGKILTGKAEIVTLGRIKSLAAKIGEADGGPHFKFFDGVDKELHQSDFSNVNFKFYVITGKATIKADVSLINGAIIAVSDEKNHPAAIEFENSSSPMVVNGMVYSAGKIKTERNVTVNYNSGFLFDPDLKEMFMDLNNWKQGI